MHCFLITICNNYKKMLKLLIQMQLMDLFEKFVVYFREVTEEYE